MFVTHWRAEHAGLAPRLAEAAGATLAMHEADAPLIADYAAERESVTPWAVATALFSETTGICVKMGAGEATSHLEYFRTRGRLERRAALHTFK